MNLLVRYPLPKASRFNRWAGPCTWSLALLFWVMGASAGSAKEYALIVGGGYSPEHNPVSFERQVLRAVNVLQQRKFASIDVLFADGDDTQPDLLDQTTARNEGPTPVAEKETEISIAMLRRVLGSEFDRPATGSDLRNHRVPHVLGAATLKSVKQWFAEQGSQLQSGDRLLLYFATHGTLAERQAGEPKSQDSELLLWGEERLRVATLGALVGTLPDGVQVTLLSPACYAGGFAELGWPNRMAVENDQAGPLHLPVAGFFATSFDRPAAGCTSMADKANVRDYASCFWSALAGSWPDGTPVKELVVGNVAAETSFDQAHAFALLSDTTLDVPMKTSDYAVRQLSRFGRADEPRLISSDPAYRDLLAAASAADKVLLDRLSLRARLTHERKLSQARTELRRLTFDLKALSDERTQLKLADRAERLQLAAALHKRFPARALPMNEAAASPAGPRRFTEQEKSKIVVWLKAAPAWSKLVASQDRLAAIDQERLLLEVQWAGYQRFLQTAESVIFAHNLPLLVDDVSILQRFETLLKAERGW